MTAPASATPSVTDDVFAQFAVIDKALASATACLALGHVRSMLEQLKRAQELSHSLNFRLESERLPDYPAATVEQPAQPEQSEQAVLL